MNGSEIYPDSGEVQVQGLLKHPRFTVQFFFLVSVPPDEVFCADPLNAELVEKPNPPNTFKYKNERNVWRKCGDSLFTFH